MLMLAIKHVLFSKWTPNRTVNRTLPPTIKALSGVFHEARNVVYQKMMFMTKHVHGVSSTLRVQNYAISSFSQLFMVITWHKQPSFTDK